MAKRKKTGKIWLFITIIAGIIIFDQITKLAAKTVLLSLPDKIAPFLPGFMRFRYIENTGMAFSLLSDATWLLTIISGIMAVVIIFLLIKYYRIINSRMFEIGLCFIAGGAIGNLIDRAAWGYVIDMLEFEFVNFAIFNVADCFVTFGAVMFCLAILGKRDKITGGVSSGTDVDADC